MTHHLQNYIICGAVFLLLKTLFEMEMFGSHEITKRRWKLQELGSQR